MTKAGPLAIMTAMPEEARALLDAIGGDADVIEHGRRSYHAADLHGRRVVVAVSRCGKVAAATTATEMIVRHGASALVFTGVAGALGDEVRVGDVVVADALLQHDLDARPLWPRHVVPLLEEGTFGTDPSLTGAIAAGAEAFVASRSAAPNDASASQRGARVHRGLIVSGDQFIHDAEHASAIRGLAPEALCVEMEGAAAAQVAFEYGVPIAVFRAISDRADGDASAHFGASLGSFAAAYSSGILERALPALAPSGHAL